MRRAFTGTTRPPCQGEYGTIGTECYCAAERRIRPAIVTDADLAAGHPGEVRQRDLAASQIVSGIGDLCPVDYLPNPAWGLGSACRGVRVRTCGGDPRVEKLEQEAALADRGQDVALGIDYALTPRRPDPTTSRRRRGAAYARPVDPWSRQRQPRPVWQRRAATGWFAGE